MLRVEISRLKGLAVVVLFACALLATGIAHRVPVAGQAAVLAYVLAGGSAADLCADPAGKTPTFTPIRNARSAIWWAARCCPAGRRRCGMPS